MIQSGSVSALPIMDLPLSKTSHLLSIGDLVYYLRTQRNWTQEQLAKKTGLSVRTIRFVEHNIHRPFPKTLSELSRVLKTDLLVLLNHGSPYTPST